MYHHSPQPRASKEDCLFARSSSFTNSVLGGVFFLKKFFFLNFNLFIYKSRDLLIERWPLRPYFVNQHIAVKTLYSLKVVVNTDSPQRMTGLDISQSLHAR